ncbi:DUF4279 domain-containing protein [Ruminococcus sp. HUN007]|uniref:DUF4279 domain-containing protein n=1 Tax=Ruminococcus sp. HUN007 TaxID=1514668 RepID=UPI000ABF8C76|nr:DUF4279 domain-containing protein [Ruminococcus sp. HUN007]
MFKHKCEMCGLEFETNNTRAKYCIYCRDKVQVQRNRAYAEKKKSGSAVKIGSEQVCPICGKTYTVTSGSQKYCKECTAGKKRKKSAPNTEYLKGHYDYIRVNVPKGEREKIKAYAESLGMSVNKLLLTALEEYQDKHNNSKASSQSSCYTYFMIRGNFDPDSITELLGLVPEKTWRIGDKRKNGTVYDFAMWQYGTCDAYDVYVENQMLKTITPLLSKISALKEIKQRYDVEFTLEVVPTIKSSEGVPCVAPSMEVMQFCCDTATKIDIDLYVDIDE